MEKPRLTKEETSQLLKELDRIKVYKTEIEFRRRSCMDRMESIQKELSEMGYNSTEEVASAYIKLTNDLESSREEIKSLVQELEEALK